MAATWAATAPALWSAAKRGLRRMDLFPYVIWAMVGLGFIYYFRQVKTASPERRDRIRDLLVVGAMTAVTPFFTEAKGWAFNMKVTGGLIFAYGWVLLVIDRFKAGYKE